MSALNRFLKSSWQNRAQATTLVVGNEGADLDSMVSAIAYAYLRSLQDDGASVLPVILIPRADFILRADALYLFKLVGLNPANLVFINDISLADLCARGARLILVDHNTLAGQYAKYQASVSGIIDHHRDEGLFTDAVPRLVQEVGSTASLVTRAFNLAGVSLEEDLALLLYGTILLDTVNLDPTAGRVTSVDREAVSCLDSLSPVAGDELFIAIQVAKFDTSGLSSLDILRKDYKGFRTGVQAWGMSSVTLSVADWNQRDPKWCDAVTSYMAEQGLDLLILMHGFRTPDFKRELVVLGLPPTQQDHLLALLQGAGLELSQQACPPEWSDVQVRLYNQANTHVSRKKLQPMLERFLRESFGTVG